MGNKTSIEPMFGVDTDPDDEPWIMASYDPGPEYTGFQYYTELQVYSNRPDCVNSLKVLPGLPSMNVHSYIVDTDLLKSDVRSVQYENGMTVECLVKQLMKMYEGRSSEADRVKILYNWFTAQNIKYSHYRLTQDFSAVIYHLQKLHDGKNSNAAFFSLLCYHANIPCVIVKGHVKGQGYELDKDISDDYIREWNAVLVDKQWRLVDSYWGRIYEEDAMMTDEFFLFINPEHAKYSHFPENPIWQLLEVPISRHQFLKQPILKPRFFEMTLKVVNQNEGEIRCQYEELELVFQIELGKAEKTSFLCATSIHDIANREWKFLPTLSKKVTISYESNYMIENDGENGSLDQNQVEDGAARPNRMQGQSKKEQMYLSVKIRFPDSGKYKIEIIGRTDPTMPYDRVAVYNAIVNSTGPFSDLKACGLEAVSYTEIDITSTVPETIQVIFRIRDTALTRNITLRYKMVPGTEAEQTNTGTMEKEAEQFKPNMNDIIIVPVNLDTVGEFKLLIAAMVDGEDKGTVIQYNIVTTPGLEYTALALQEAIDTRDSDKLKEAIELAKPLQTHKEVREKYDEAKMMLNRLLRNKETMKRLGNIHKNRIAVLRAYKNPNDIIVRSIKALLLLLGKPEKKLKTWSEIKIHMTDDIIRQIHEFDYQNVSNQTVRRAKHELGSEDTYSAIQQAEDVAAFVNWMQTVFETKKI